jgi:hypothetical protein
MVKLVAATLTGLILAACSTSTAGHTSKSDATDIAANLRAAVEAYSAAYLSGDGATAYAMLSMRCRSLHSKDEYISLTALAKQMYGNQPVRTFGIDSRSGNTARVTYTFDNHDIDQTNEPWVREVGFWKEDDCS